MAQESARRGHQYHFSALSLGEHLLSSRARHQPGLGNVGIHDIEKALRRHIDDLRHVVLAGGNDKDVDAPKLLHARLDHGGNRGGIGDVAEVRCDARGLVHGFSERGGVAIDGKDLGAFFHEAHGGGAAIAPARADRAGAADDGDLVLKP